MQKNKKKITTKDLAYMGLFVALITVCSWLSFRIEPLNYTFQLLAVLLCAGLLGWWRGLLVVLAYILLGLVGVPVFAGFTSGVVAPTRGYIIGFIFTVIIVGFAYKINFQKIISSLKIASVLNILFYVLAMVVGVAVCYVFGTAWFIGFMGTKGTTYSVAEALGLCVFPYVWFDAVKIAVAVFLAGVLKRFVKI